MEITSIFTKNLPICQRALCQHLSIFPNHHLKEMGADLGNPQNTTPLAENDFAKET